MMNGSNTYSNVLVIMITVEKPAEHITKDMMVINILIVSKVVSVIFEMLYFLIVWVGLS